MKIFNSQSSRIDQRTENNIIVDYVFEKFFHITLNLLYFYLKSLYLSIMMNKGFYRKV
jgi:hypothetical protein